MFPSASQFDVYITAPGTDATRRTTIPRLLGLYPLDARGEEALASGERILLRADQSDHAAQRIARDLKSIGFRVDLIARSSSLEAVGIDGGVDEPVAQHKMPQSSSSPLFDVGLGLVGIDGNDEPAHDEPAAPAATGVGSLLGLFGGAAPRTAADALEPDEAASVPRAPAPRRAPPPKVAAPAAAPAPVSPAPAGRFRPADMNDESGGLQLDQPELSLPERAAPPPQVDEVAEIPRCPTHDVPRVRGRCEVCDADERYVRSRLLGGKLREKPGVRLGIGLGAGLLVGWLVTAPMARHAEMKVQNLRTQADRERNRPTEEAQTRALQLDAEADGESSGAFTKTFGIWAVIAGVVTAGWMKLT